MIDRKNLINPPKPSSYRPAQVESNWINSLIGMVHKLKINEVPKIAEVVRKIAVKGNQTAAKKWVKLLAKEYYQQELNPNHFLSIENNLQGEILLGYTEDSKPFGLNRDDLVRHTFISGQSGFGKSELMKSIFLQAKEKGIHVVYLDRKGDMDCLAREGIDIIHWSHIRLNPLCPPDTKVSIYEYRNDFVKTFSELFQFWTRGMSIFMQGVDMLYRDFGVYERWPVWDWGKMVFPTIIELLELFKGYDFGKRIKGHGKESLLSIIDKLTSLIIELQPIISCQRGFDKARLYREKRAISFNLDGLSSEYQNFFVVTDVLGFAHYFKTYGPRNQLNMLFLFDEAKGLFGKSNQDKFIVKDLVAKIREWGLGLVCADQIPSEISQFLFSNIGTLIMFRHSDGNDLQRLRYSSGATVDQILENYSLKPGDAIVRSMKSKDLHKIKIPFEPVEKFIPREEVDRLMAPRLEELKRDVIPYRKREKEENTTKEKQGERIPINQEERNFLEYLSKNFDQPAYKIYEALGLGSSAGFRIKERLLKKKYISQVHTNLGKDGKKALFLVPNPIVFEEFGIELGPGRGKALHKHFQAELKSQAEKLGFTAIIEENFNGTPEAPDIGLEKDGNKIAVEICITSKPSQESSNINKNFRLGLNFVILTFVNQKVLEKTKELSTAKYSKEILEKVEFCLVNQFFTVLGKF